MPMDKNGSGGDWWKGSFPTWIVAILIGVIGFFLQRELRINDDCRKAQAAAITELMVDVTDLKARILSLEDTVAENHQLLTEIGKKVGYRPRQ